MYDGTSPSMKSSCLGGFLYRQWGLFMLDVIGYGGDLRLPCLNTDLSVCLSVSPISECYTRYKKNLLLLKQARVRQKGRRKKTAQRKDF